MMVKHYVIITYLHLISLRGLGVETDVKQHAHSKQNTSAGNAIDDYLMEPHLIEEVTTLTIFGYLVLLSRDVYDSISPFSS